MPVRDACVRAVNLQLIKRHEYRKIIRFWNCHCPWYTPNDPIHQARLLKTSRCHLILWEDAQHHEIMRNEIFFSSPALYKTPAFRIIWLGSIVRLAWIKETSKNRNQWTFTREQVNLRGREIFLFGNWKFIAVQFWSFFLHDYKNPFLVILGVYIRRR